MEIYLLEDIHLSYSRPVFLSLLLHGLMAAVIEFVHHHQSLDILERVSKSIEQCDK